PPWNGPCRRRRLSISSTNCLASAKDHRFAMSLSLAYPRVTTVGDFFALLKPRVMSLVVFTGLAGMVAAPGHVHPLTAFAALLCIAVAAGASGCLNMAYDHDIDRLMA